MARKSITIEALPNEILITILSSFSTRHLLPLTTTSYHFLLLIRRVIHQRLLTTASIQSHSLILECFHMSTRLTTPYLFCEYMGTDGLDQALDLPCNVGLDQAVDTPCNVGFPEDVNHTRRLRPLSSFYSRFLPLKPVASPVSPRTHPAGGLTPEDDSPITGASFFNSDEAPFVSQDIDLESHELFSQLMTIVNLVKVGPRRGLFLSCVSLVDQPLRLWRDWLWERAASSALEGKHKGQGEDEEKRKTDGDVSEQGAGVLWVDREKNVGLRIGVVQGRDVAASILQSKDEDVPVTYCLHFEELLIRTTQLLLMVEQSREQEVNYTGNALAIGSWDT